MSISYGLNLRLLAAFRFLLVPLVRILVRNGITINETYEVLKATYARVSATDLAVPGQPMSHSRISITTGLPRKEVLRVLRNEEQLRKALESNAGQVVNVIQGWHNAAEFLGPYGVPRDLAFGREKKGALSFTDLVEQFAPSLDPSLVLSELLRVGAAKVAEESGMIRVLKRTYIPEKMAPELVEIFSRGVRRYVETIDHNLAERDANRRRFERWVFPDHGLRQEDWAQFNELIRTRLQDVIEDLETKFALFPRPQATDEVLSVGVGLYVYRDDLNDDRTFQGIVEKLLQEDPGTDAQIRHNEE